LYKKHIKVNKKGRQLIDKYNNLERRYDREKPGEMVSDMKGTQKVLDYKDPNKKDVILQASSPGSPCSLEP
jgi:hypothetical protein